MADKNLIPYKTPKSGVFNLRAGALQSRDEVLIVAGLARLDDERTAHTIVLKWSGALPWHGVALNWSSSTCCAIPQQGGAFCLLGIDGEVGLVHGDELYEGDVGTTSLSAVTPVDRSIYAVGAVGRVLRSEGGRSWDRVRHAEEVNDDLLEAVAPYAPDEVYAVGAEGAIVLVRPTSAQRIQSPTNLVLAGICRGPGDILYACGQKGLILRGREDAWEIVEQSVTKEDLWDICTFQDRLFLTSTRFLYELKGDTLEAVRFEHETPLSFYKLTTADGLLLSVGQRDAFLFDGSEWTRLM